MITASRDYIEFAISIEIFVLHVQRYMKPVNLYRYIEQCRHHFFVYNDLW